jgi:APA family basic amino acid/polyamine antiporter
VNATPCAGRREQGAVSRAPGGGTDGPDVAGPHLLRRLGLRDAVVLGLGSMVGAGIFAALSPAARAAGRWLPLAVVVAGLVAWCNATSSGRLAAVHPQAGGTYVYATARLGPAWGHLAGWGFVVGKTASCAAMAFTVGAYAAPGHPRTAGLAGLAVAVLLGTGGLQRGARLTRVLLGAALAALAVVVVVAWVSPAGPPAGEALAGPPGRPGLYGLLQGAGLMFFAFAGYARIATLGEEVREPRRTIPRAVALALGLAVALYLTVVVSALHALDAPGLAAVPAPLAAVVAGVPGGWAPQIVRAGAVAASLGALLALLLGVSRVAFAMARDRLLPGLLTGVRRGVPFTAELVVAGVVAALVLVADLRHVIGFSSTTVLAYYAITHLAAWRLRPDEGRPHLAVLALGLGGCVVLALTLPPASVLAGTGVLLVGALTGRLTTLRATRGG